MLLFIIIEGLSATIYHRDRKPFIVELDLLLYILFMDLRF